MFLYGGLPTDSTSTEVEKLSYSERYPFPDWRGNVAARKPIKKKQYKGGMFTPLPDADMFTSSLASQKSSKLAQSIPDTITTSTAKNIETTAKKTNIFKSTVKFFTKLFKKAPEV